MKKALLILAISATITGCVTTKIGATEDEFAKSCRIASWASPQTIPLVSGDAVSICAGAEHRLFSGGRLVRSLSRGEAFALIDDSQCLTWGAQPGEPAYQQCRLGLAQIRAQRDVAQQQNAAAMLQSAIMYNALLAPAPAASPTLNCTSTVMGSFTSYNCQ